MYRQRLFVIVIILLVVGIAACSQGNSENNDTTEAVEIPPSYKKIEGDGMEIWLPDSFEGGNLEEDLDFIVEKLDQLGPEYSQISEMISRNPSMFALWAFDWEIVDTSFLTNVNVTREKVPSGMNINAYMDLLSEQLPPGFNITNRETVTIGDQSVGRIFVDFSVTGIEGKEIIYIYKVDNTIWIVTFATSVDEFDERLPDFETSAQTFAVD